MRTKLLFGGLAAIVAFLLATNPLVAQAAGFITSADIVNSTIKSKDVKDNNLKGKDVRDNTLTGADVDESTLGVVPNAGALGGKSAGQFATAGEFVAVSGFDVECDPGDTTFLNCASAAVNLARPSRLLLNSHTPFGDDSTDGATGSCRLLLDGNVLTGTTTRVGIGGTSGGVSDDDNTGMGVTNVTAIVPAGAHTVTQQCNETSADIDFNDLSMSVLAVPAG